MHLIKILSFIKKVIQDNKSQRQRFFGSICNRCSKIFVMTEYSWPLLKKLQILRISKAFKDHI